MTRPRYALACPKGHAERLRLRVLVDAPPIVGADGELHPDLESTECEPQPTGSMAGIDSGVWCPTCGEWYPESDCVHDADAAGNAIIPDLGGPS